MFHTIEDISARHRAKKAWAANQASSESQILDLGHEIPSTVPMDLQTELESCIRRLSCSITGVVVTGSMTHAASTNLLPLQKREVE